MTFEHRQYQTDSYNAIKDTYRKGIKKVILALSTGAGKSHIAIQMIKSSLAKGKRVGFCVDRIILAEQFANMAYNEGITNFSIMQADNILYNSDSNFQIMTAQTLARRSIEPFDFLVYDECHIVYKSIVKLMKEWTDTYFLGLTATPFTKGLGRLWEDIVNGVTMSQLIKERYLSEYIAYGPSKPDLKGVRTSAGDYNKKDLAERTDKKQLIGDIVEHWMKIANDRQTVIGAVNVPHAENIAKAFKDKDIRADVIHCYLKSEEIKDKLERFKDGDIQVLSSVDLISRGFDQPNVECMIVARPTKSLNYHLQFLGRGLRPSPNERKLIILDHAGNIERLGFPDDEFDMTLDMGIKNPKKHKKKEKLPKPCPECHILFIGQKCPVCGFMRKRKANVTTKEGDLEELQKKRHKAATPEQKEKIYAKLLAGAKAANERFPDKLKKVEGWASWQYRERYGVWPVNKNVEYDWRFYEYLLTVPSWQLWKIIWGLAKK